MNRDPYWNASNAVTRLEEVDRKLIMEAYPEWIQEVMAETGLDLSTVPERAFIAGAAWAIQWRWE